MENISIEDMKQMQFELYEKNKQQWKNMQPQYAKDYLLYMVEEMGEAIAIIKKQGIDAIMQDEKVRTRFVEEFCDVLMYYVEVLNRLHISSEELTKAYKAKHEINLNRDYVQERKDKIGNIEK